MVRRYSHTAVITIETNGKWVKGEYQAGETNEIVLTGRYDPESDGRVVIKNNTFGEEKQIKGYFYTRPLSNELKITRLRIDLLDIDVDVVCCENYQSHSIICI